MQKTAAPERATQETRPAVFSEPSVVAPQTTSGRKKRNPVVLAVVVIILAGMAGAVAFMVVNRESPEQHIGRLMREAAGLQPVKQAFFASERQVDDAFREQFRNMFRVNQQFVALQNKVDANEIGKIGSPESFTDPDYAAEGIRQLHASYIFDKQLEQKIQEIADNLRHTINGTNWSASRKTEALAGFERALKKRQLLLNAEQAYVQAVDDIYEYSYGHYTAFQLENEELKSADESALRDFNSKMNEYNARRYDLLQAQQEFTRFQKDLLNKMGMSSKDAGLQ